jgi:hypothetical protein
MQGQKGDFLGDQNNDAHSYLKTSATEAKIVIEILVLRVPQLNLNNQVNEIKHQYEQEQVLKRQQQNLTDQSPPKLPIERNRPIKSILAQLNPDFDRTSYTQTLPKI